MTWTGEARGGEAVEAYEVALTQLGEVILHQEQIMANLDAEYRAADGRRAAGVNTMPGDVLVISHTHDAHAVDVLARLQQRGLEPVLFDRRDARIGSRPPGTQQRRIR